MSKNRYSGLGELPERHENLMPGSGFSRGAPNRAPESRTITPDFITGSTSTFAVTTTAQKLLSSNLRRAYLFFQNRGTDTIYLAIGNNIDPSNNNAIELAAGAIYEPNTNSKLMIYNDVYVKSASGTQNLVYIEGVNVFPNT